MEQLLLGKVSSGRRWVNLYLQRCFQEQLGSLSHGMRAARPAPPGSVVLPALGAVGGRARSPAQGMALPLLPSLPLLRAPAISRRRHGQRSCREWGRNEGIKAVPSLSARLGEGGRPFGVSSTG